MKRIRIEDYEIMGIRPLLIDNLNRLKSNSISESRIATRWLRAVLKLLLHRGCNPKRKKGIMCLVVNMRIPYT